MTKDLTPTEAAEVLGLSVISVRNLLKRGDLRGYKMGGGNLRYRPWRIRRKDLNAYINTRRVYNDTPEFHEAMLRGGHLED